MAIEEYPNNSHKAKEKTQLTEKHVDRVVTGKVVRKKKSEIKKLGDVFISDDASNVKSYIVEEVFIPAVKKLLDDIVSNGIHMILYGSSGRGGSRLDASKVSYRAYYDDRGGRDLNVGYRSRSMFDYEELSFANRADAEAVLDRMDEMIATYQVASVLDLYDMAGVSNDNPQTKKYGWTNIRTAEVIRGRDGYYLKLPKPLPFD